MQRVVWQFTITQVVRSSKS